MNSSSAGVIVSARLFPTVLFTSSTLDVSGGGDDILSAIITTSPLIIASAIESVISFLFTDAVFGIVILRSDAIVASFFSSGFSPEIYALTSSLFLKVSLFASLLSNKVLVATKRYKISLELFITLFSGGRSEASGISTV